MLKKNKKKTFLLLVNWTKIYILISYDNKTRKTTECQVILYLNEKKERHSANKDRIFPKNLWGQKETMKSRKKHLVFRKIYNDN